MKFKKTLFLWLILAVVFCYAKIDARMLKIQSNYLGFSSYNSQFYTEVFMPYSEENETKLQLLNNSFNKKLDCPPDVLIVIDDKHFTEKERDFLINYEKDLMKSGMLMYIYNFKGIEFEFFVKLNKLSEISNNSRLGQNSVLSFIVFTYINQFKDIFKPLNYIINKHKN